MELEPIEDKTKMLTRTLTDSERSKLLELIETLKKIRDFVYTNREYTTSNIRETMSDVDEIFSRGIWFDIKSIPHVLLDICNYLYLCLNPLSSYEYSGGPTIKSFDRAYLRSMLDAAITEIYAASHGEVLPESVALYNKYKREREYRMMRQGLR